MTIYSSDPVAQIVRETHVEDGDIIFETRQDVTELVEENKALYAMTDEHAPWRDGFGTLVGRIPIALYFNLLVRGLIDEKGEGDKSLLRYLDDRDNLHLRTRPGRLSR